MVARTSTRVGGAVDRDVDEIDLAGLVVGRAVGEAQRDLDARRRRPAGRSRCARRNSRWLTGKVTYIGSWLTIERQHAAVRSDHVALRDAGAADPAGDRRGDLGVAEVDLAPSADWPRRSGSAPWACSSAASAWSRATTVPAFRSSSSCARCKLDRGERLRRLAALQRRPRACSTAASKSPGSIR